MMLQVRIQFILEKTLYAASLPRAPNDAKPKWTPKLSTNSRNDLSKSTHRWLSSISFSCQIDCVIVVKYFPFLFFIIEQ